MNTVRVAICGAAMSASVFGGLAGDLPVIVGTVGDRTLEKTGFRLSGDAVYSTTNCTPRFGAATTIDVAGHVLTLQMKDKSWDNTYFSGCVVTNSSASPSRMVLPSVWGKYHVHTREWHGGPQNVVDVSNGRFYIRTKVDSPDCWTLRLSGTETVMGDAVTGADAARYEWAGPVEVLGQVHFADDTNTEEGGWGCTLSGPLSGPATASIGLSRAFCLRVGSKVNTFAGSWNLGGGGNGAYRCRLDLLKGAAFSGSRVKIADSDLHLDAETVFHLPPTRHAFGDCLIEGGTKGSTMASLRKTGEGTLTVDSPIEVLGTLRLEAGVLAVTKGGHLPVVHRLFCLPGTALALNGRELVVDELVGNPEIRGGGRLVAGKTVRPTVDAAGRAAETLEMLRSVAQARQFFWAWTESWVPWGGLTGEDWPRFQTKVGTRTGRAPRVMYYDLATVTGVREPPRYFEEHRQAVSDAIRTHWRANRGIPVFSWHMDHPCCTNGFNQAWYRYKCREHRNVIKDILEGSKYPCGAHTQWKRDFRKPYESPRAWYFERLDEIADFLNRLVDDDGTRIPVILRYEHECDGAWFWWGHTWCTPNEFVAFSRMTADYLRGKCGRDNLRFAYTPDRTWKEMGQEGDNAHNFLSWYPGDAYTDIGGFDDYSIGKGKTAQDAERNFEETLRKLRLVSAFAREHGKVTAITETGCKDANDDFWTRVLRLATADGVDCAFVDTWGGPWTQPATEAGWADLLRFVGNPAVLTTSDAEFQRVVEAGQ